MDKNIIEGEYPANSTCSDVISSDHMLGILCNYGGSTQTIPLGASSSAIDTGDNTYTTCPTTDQRGVSRPQNAICEIGPFEVNIPRYLLTIAKGGTDSGSVSGTNISCGSNCTEYYFEDEEITLTATPNANSSFTGWSGVGIGTGTCRVSMTAAKNVTANFNLLLPNQYTLTVSLTGTGSGTVTGSGINCFEGNGADCVETFTNRTQVTLTATPNSGSSFTEWSGDCTGIGSCAFMMNTAKTVMATFDTGTT